MNTIGKHNLFRNEPTDKWIEGIPSGNGTLGVMAWGPPGELILSLGRNDLWHDCPEWHDRRITAGELHVACGNGGKFEEGLDLAEAVAYRATGTQRLEWFVHAAQPFLCLRVPRAPKTLAFRWQPPRLWSQWAEDAAGYGRRLEGKAPRKSTNPYVGRSSSDQSVKEGLAIMRFAIDGKPHVFVGVRACQGGETRPIRQKRGGFEIAAKEGSELLLLIGVWNQDRYPETGIAEAVAQLAGDGPADWSRLLASHRRWWRQFWSRSGVRLSNAVLERLWYRGVYHLGCCTRPDTLPTVLQGVWCEDGLPPWNGGYHWDLNVQTCYWPIYTGNHLELGHSLYDWYLDKLPLFRENARSQFGMDGILLPNSHGPDFAIRKGRPNDSPKGFGDAAWVCHNFWQHYEYTHDTEFLRTHCLPVFREHLKYARFLWQKGKDGRYHIEHAWSPEIDFLATPQNPMRDAAYDIAFGRFLARAYRETLKVLDERHDDLARWADDFLRHVIYPTARTTTSNYYWPIDPSVPDFFVEWPGLETQMSHRHFAHLMMIYPLAEIHRFSPYRQLRIAQNSMHMLALRGTGGWAAFSFPWASLLATYAAWPKRMAVHMLKEFAKCVVVPFNGLTLNEDYSGLGMLCLTGAFGPTHMENFTLESSMIAVTAVQDMLLHAAGDCLVFGGGASPELDGEFQGFRTRFGDTVAGRIEGGRLVSAELKSDRQGLRCLAVDGPANQWKLTPSAGMKYRKGKSLIAARFEKGGVYSLRRA